MKKYLNAAQIAKLENVSHSAVTRWAHAGKFENVRKVGREFRIPIESYRKWRESTMIPSQDERSLERTNESTNVRTFVRSQTPSLQAPN